ncbi:uncharacterized protein LOC129947553 [Eupeodes corollae]|uniref:uncharacterized protein LOC129947553 n=1 Tax=Eupeodes corollae TaxID=290404 RepID=UPI002492839B|nr:uncharacterized protein LOC129947553 [Eupeodes corollae]
MHAVLQRNQWMVGKVYGKILGTILSAKCKEICSIEVAQGVARISKKKISENEKIVIAILDLNEAVSGNLSGKQFGDTSDANIQVAAGSSTSVNVTVEEADEQEVLLAMFNDDSLPQPDNNENTEPQPDNSEHFAEDVNPPPSRNKKAPMLIGVKLVVPLKNYHFSFLPGNFFCFLFSYLIIALHHDFRFFEFRFFCRSFRNS